jgi:hypothetical protein
LVFSASTFRSRWNESPTIICTGCWSSPHRWIQTRTIVALYTRWAMTSSFMHLLIRTGERLCLSGCRFTQSFDTRDKSSNNKHVLSEERVTNEFRSSPQVTEDLSYGAANVYPMRTIGCNDCATSGYLDPKIVSEWMWKVNACLYSLWRGQWGEVGVNVLGTWAPSSWFKVLQLRNSSSLQQDPITPRTLNHFSRKTRRSISTIEIAFLNAS